MFPAGEIPQGRLLAGQAPSFTSFGWFFFWPPQLAGLERAEMNRWAWRTSGYGTFQTCRSPWGMSVVGGEPEVT
jgi:hypothetical protein